MIVLSLLLNIAVLVPVCFGLISDAQWTRQSYGEASASRGILFSVYIAIAAVSLILTFYREPKFVGALLLIQVLYKVSTPFTVQSIANPVVICNLLIAAFHSFTLLLIYREISWIRS
ncbi:MAG: hypothetical protein AB7Q37_06055 [Pyrinomonadaceae bacterium]